MKFFIICQIEWRYNATVCIHYSRVMNETVFQFLCFISNFIKLIEIRNFLIKVSVFSVSLNEKKSIGFILHKFLYETEMNIIFKRYTHGQTCLTHIFSDGTKTIYRNSIIFISFF